MVRRCRVGRRPRRGFTIIEVLVAITVIMIGVLALVGSGALVVKMLARGNRATRAAFYAQEHVERLRSTPCQLLSSGTQAYAGNYTVTWTVQNLVSGTYRPALVVSTYVGGVGSTRADTMEVTILCIR
jgi:Tfp pilus assembly protein PilV